jgi:hypothetical protein
MAKRGRKPKNKNYFGQEEETAVLDYLSVEDMETKNFIYNDKLKPAFEKMIESIIRKYHLYVPEETYEETFYDTLSFLMTKTNRFNCDKQTKAYSYYGTICKNYLKSKLQKYNKKLQRNPSYDLNDEEFSNNIKYSNVADKSAKIAIEIVDNMIIRLNSMLTNEKYHLKENEAKLAKALINLFENWDFVMSTDGSNKLNRNAVLFFLREKTGLDTKGVRDNMKKFRKEYLMIRDYVIS